MPRKNIDDELYEKNNTTHSSTTPNTNNKPLSKLVKFRFSASSPILKASQSENELFVNERVNQNDSDHDNDTKSIVINKQIEETDVLKIISTSSESGYSKYVLVKKYF